MFPRNLLTSTALRSGSEAGGAGGGGVGADGKPTATTGSLTPEQVEAFINSAATMSSAVKELGELAKNRNAAPQNPTPEPEPEDPNPLPELDDIQFETLTQRQIFDLMAKVNAKALKEALTPLETQILNLGSASQVSQASAQIKEVATEHPDFWEWREEMKVIAQAEGIVNPKRLYQLARQDNAKKAGEMDTKYKKPDNDDNLRAGGRKGFGGLIDGGAMGERKSGKMSATDAAEAAWAEIEQAFGKIG